MTKQCIQTQLKNVIRMMYNTIIFKLSSKSIYNTIIFKLNRIWKVQSESNWKMWGSVKSFMKPTWNRPLAALPLWSLLVLPCGLAPLISLPPWSLHTLSMISSWRFHVGFIKVSSRFYVGFMKPMGFMCGWRFHRFHVGFVWVSCGFHGFHRFYVGFI